MPKLLKKLSELLIFALILATNIPTILTGVIPQTFAQQSSVEVSGFNTVAGFSALLKASGTPYTEIDIMVEKPDRAIVSFPATLDENGRASVDLYAYHTKKAGTYKVSGKNRDSSDFGIINTFQVYADEVSPTRSSVTLSHLTLPANGYQFATLTVQLQDDYGNSIVGHEVQIISSRPDDIVENFSSSISDQLGLVKFKIASREPGVSYLIMQDNSANVTLEHRAKIAFLEVTDANLEVGGETVILAQEANAAPASTTTLLNITGISQTVNAETPLTFKVQALDKNRTIDNNYRSKIHFSSSDPNATVPQDYSFTESDEGEHTFSVALKFITTGTQTLTVTDLNNLSIKGSIEVNVTGSGNPDTANTNGSDIQLTNPKAGSIANNIIQFNGIGPGLTELTIFDGENKIASVLSDADGSFQYLSTPIPDGKHDFSVAVMNKETKIKTSNHVQVKIDTQAPVIDAIEIKPGTEIIGRQQFEINVFSEARLSKATAIFNNNNYPLTAQAGNTAKYSTAIIAPNQLGNFPIDIILIDELGNDATYPNSSNIIITELGEGNLPAANENPDNNVFLPSKVTGVEATPGDGRIILKWEPSIDDTYIQNYRIYYGTDPNNLALTANTFDDTTTWYVPNLAPQTTYYFEMTAIDSDFNESAERSNIVFATTLDGEYVPDNNPPTSQTGDQTAQTDQNQTTEDNANNAENSPDEVIIPENQPESGTGTTTLVLLTLAYVQLYVILRKYIRRKKPVC